MERPKVDNKWGAAVFCCFITVPVSVAGISIAKIVMGAIYLHDCDIEKKIPIYLIVSGMLSLLLGSFIATRLRRDKDESNFGMGGGLGNVGVAILWSLLAVLIYTVWLICCSVWVYPNYEKLTSNHVTCSQEVIINCVHGNCNMTFLKFAFSVVTIDWICSALVLISLMIFCSALFCVRYRLESHELSKN